jgi:hypothetical protein
MRNAKMVRRQLYLSVSLSEELKKWSTSCKIPESEILRRALSAYLEQERRRSVPLEQNPVLKAIGIFEGGQECFNAGEKHDEIIYGLKNTGLK